MIYITDSRTIVLDAQVLNIPREYSADIVKYIRSLLIRKFKLNDSFCNVDHIFSAGKLAITLPENSVTKHTVFVVEKLAAEYSCEVRCSAKIALLFTECVSCPTVPFNPSEAYHPNEYPGERTYGRLIFDKSPHEKFVGQLTDSHARSAVVEHKKITETVEKPTHTVSIANGGKFVMPVTISKMVNGKLQKVR